MGQELIKRAVDASVFLINLTSALIKFVMTAALVPVCHQTHNKPERPAKKRDGRGDCGTAHLNKSHSGQWLTFTIIPPSNLRVTTS